MPQGPTETAHEWHARALREATEADNAVRPYVMLGTEHGTGAEPVSPEHAAAAARWEQAQADLEAATEAVEQSTG